ncbi:hypothetical protein SAMN05216503_2912 [Polaribacter sp. KT25b]|uniref:hypothetical protein n=1 Tax=Polaribacter sp. KT25b TaxID=1855336 RepID=UPI00087AC175|nr:hypothetical protein [Polaribacter sp. KT25b]SDS39100.1 hypothetical protein SAMN05216503_2912 [Polaribacter sp. KT25b]
MSTNHKNNEEEVDLGSLFVIIGKGFSKFFNFIGTIIKRIFDFIISTLIFLKQNIIKISIAGIIGLVAGVFLEVKTPTRFGSDLLLEPNFKSARQLYNNINYYNDLVKQKDTLTLQKTFNIDKASAASIKKFEIVPLKVDGDLIDAYNNLILSVDTLTIKSYEYADFKEAFTDYDYKVHKVTVIAEKNNVFDKLDSVIISSVVNNKYFNRIKVLTNENLNRTDSLYRENLTQIDSLRRVYMQVMVEEAKKSVTGTSIDLGSQKKTTKELELFDTNRKINYDLGVIANEKSQKYDVINVISNFQPIGYKIKGITKNYAFLLAILAAGFMILFLLLIKLNTFLENYKK